MVLLKNSAGALPLNKSVKRVAVIGGYADRGVLAGGGSSLVYPAGGNAMPGLEPKNWPGPVMVYPSSPLKAIQERLPKAVVTYHDGADRAAAAKLARESDLVWWCSPPSGRAKAWTFPICCCPTSRMN